MAGADAGYVPIHKGLETAIPDANNGLRKLDDTVWMFRVAMYHVSRVAISCAKLDGVIIRVREHPKDG